MTSYNNRFKSRSLLFPDTNKEIIVINKDHTSQTLKKLKITNNLTVEKNAIVNFPNISLGIITTNNITIKEIINNRVIIVNTNVTLPIDRSCNGYEIILYNNGIHVINIIPNNIELNMNKSIRLIYVDKLKSWIN